MISPIDSVENIVERGENAGYQHFLLFPKCFKQTFSAGSLKSDLRGKGLLVNYKINWYTVRLRGGTDNSPLGQYPTRTIAHWTIAHWTIAHC